MARTTTALVEFFGVGKLVLSCSFGLTFVAFADCVWKSLKTSEEVSKSLEKSQVFNYPIRKTEVKKMSLTEKVEFKA